MKKKFNVLCVEDSLPDFILLKKALNKIKEVKLNILNVANGQDAILFLKKEQTTTVDVLSI